MLEIRNKHTYFLTNTIINNCILACNFKSLKETYLTNCHMLLGRQEETEMFHVVFPPYMGRIFSKKGFHGGRRWGGQIYARQIYIVHWCVDRHVGS